MDMNLFCDMEEARRIVQDSWRQYKTTPKNTYQYHLAVEMVQLARGQADVFGITPLQVHIWEQEIEQEIERHANR